MGPIIPSPTVSPALNPCLLCREVENTMHILLKCPETKRWRYQFLSAEWLKINEEVAYRKTAGCNSINKLKGLREVFI
jgi:hypothetical protein